MPDFHEVKLFLGAAELRGGSCAEAGLSAGSEVSCVAAASPALAMEAVRAWDDGLAALLAHLHAFIAWSSFGGVRVELGAQIFSDSLAVAKVLGRSCDAEIVGPKVIGAMRYNLRIPRYMLWMIALDEMLSRDRMALPQDEIEALLKYLPNLPDAWRALRDRECPVEECMSIMMASCRLVAAFGDASLLGRFQMEMDGLRSHVDIASCDVAMRLLTEGIERCAASA